MADSAVALGSGGGGGAGAGHIAVAALPGANLANASEGVIYIRLSDRSLWDADPATVTHATNNEALVDTHFDGVHTSPPANPNDVEQYYYFNGVNSQTWAVANAGGTAWTGPPQSGIDSYFPADHIWLAVGGNVNEGRFANEAAAFAFAQQENFDLTKMLVYFDESSTLIEALTVTTTHTPAAWHQVNPAGAGVAGAPGNAGTNGTNGTNGMDGSPGSPGTNGMDGSNGAMGAAGANGSDGATGATGATGAPGTPGGQGTATPPTIIVDAISYTAHGAVTVGSWRDYDVLQFIYFDGNSYYPAISFATSALELANAAGKVMRLSFEQNTSLDIHSTDGSDDITVDFHNSGPIVGANSTMTVLGWFAGSNGADGSDGTAGAAGAAGADGAQGQRGPAGTGAGIAVQDEGGTTETIQTLNVVGASAEITVAGDVGTLTIVGTGGGTPVDHTAYINWSDDDVGTEAEALAGNNSTNGVLTIPARSANGWIIMYLPVSEGFPTTIHLNGNPTPVNNAFTQEADAMQIDVSGTAHYVLVSTSEQNAMILGTGSRTYTLGY